MGLIPCLALALAATPWVQKRDLPEARIFEIAATINGRVYAVTSGEDGTPGTVVWEYTPASDAWIRKSHANLIRHSFGAGALDGKIWIWGGVAGNRLVASTEVYDPAADRWTTRAPLPQPRMFAKGAGVNHMLYAVGGIIPPGRNQVPLIHQYDPNTDAWTRKADMPRHRDAYRVAAAAGKVYVLGNLGGDVNVLEYDPAADRWAVKSPMPTPRFDFGIHASGSLIYTFGGMGLDTLEVYDAAADHWIAKPPMPAKNWEQVAAEVDGRIYMIGGGFPAGSVLKTLWQYDPAPALRNGVYAVLREAATPEEAGAAGSRVLRYDRKYSDADRGKPPRHVAIDTASFVPLILAMPPSATTDQRGWTTLSVTLAREHVKPLENFTRAHLGGGVAIVLDGEIVTIHKVQAVIQDGRAVISRCFDNACQVLKAKLTRE